MFKVEKENVLAATTTTSECVRLQRRMKGNFELSFFF